MSSEIEGGSTTQEGMNASLPELPLTQQVFAWSLRALGYAAPQGISSSTLKNAQSGKPIPRSWDDLADALVRALGGSANAATIEAAKKAFRAIDQRISELPRIEGISRRALLKIPLGLAFRALGSRLGALIAALAMKRGNRVEEWGWLAKPFEAGFFGEVVERLLERALPGATLEERKERIEQAVDWRTLERWKSGDVEVPNTLDLSDLAACLGEDAELFLRLARLAACLRRDLLRWFDDEKFVRQWSGSVTGIAQRVAGLLSSPVYFDEVLSWYHEGLASEHGTSVFEGMCGMFGSLLLGASREQLVNACEKARRAGFDSREGGALLQLWISTMVIFPNPLLMVEIDYLMGRSSTMTSMGMDPIRLIGTYWQVLRLFTLLAYDDGAVVSGSDGSSVEVSAEARLAAREFLRSHEHWADEDCTQEDRCFKHVISVFGIEALQILDRIDDPTPSLLLKARGREFEEFLPEEIVRRHLGMCLARARRLAERGDVSSALEWFDRAKENGRFSANELEDYDRLLTARAHHLLNLTAQARKTARRCGGADVRDSIREMLLAAIALAEELIAEVLQHGTTPSGSLTPESLVLSIPLLLRSTLARVECGDEPSEAYDLAVDHLCSALERHPTHGRLLAVWALVTAAEESPDAAEAKAKAVHFGAAAFFEREWRRIEHDLSEHD